MLIKYKEEEVCVDEASFKVSGSRRSSDARSLARYRLLHHLHDELSLRRFMPAFHDGPLSSAICLRGRLVKLPIENGSLVIRRF